MDIIECTWRALCDYFVAGGDLPDIQTLFSGVNLARPREAAETVLANMLFEVAKTICRFSPWYTKPTRAFGISVLRDCKTNSVGCLLAPEAGPKVEKTAAPRTSSASTARPSKKQPPIAASARCRLRNQA